MQKQNILLFPFRNVLKVAGEMGWGFNGLEIFTNFMISLLIDKYCCVNFL